MRLGFYVAFIALLALFFTVTLPSLLRQSFSKSERRPPAEPEGVLPFPSFHANGCSGHIPWYLLGDQDVSQRHFTTGNRISLYTYLDLLTSKTAHLSAQECSYRLRCPLVQVGRTGWTFFSVCGIMHREGAAAVLERVPLALPRILSRELREPIFYRNFNPPFFIFLFFWESREKEQTFFPNAFQTTRKMLL